MTFSKTVDIAPFGKARPRVTRNGTFMPPKYTANKNSLRWQFGAMPVEFADSLVSLQLVAYRPMPKSWSKKKRQSMAGTYAAPKPDIDNILGAVMDALFDEDSNVVETAARKVWGEVGQLEISIAIADEVNE